MKSKRIGGNVVELIDLLVNLAIQGLNLSADRGGLGGAELGVKFEKAVNLVN
uniref:Uncharacterized protein n=1 Tax=Desertifilum tharense IPPAS B-1220 TaxID=1781255 RepID=A0ACD5GTY0_9CYAN